MIEPGPLTQRSLYALSGPRYGDLVKLITPLTDTLSQARPTGRIHQCIYLMAERGAAPTVHGVTHTQLVTKQTVHGVLGSEAELVIFDAYSDFDCDSLAAVAGSITAGGSLLLLIPTLDSWHETRFLHRFAYQLRAATLQTKLPSVANTNVNSHGVELRELMTEPPSSHSDPYEEQQALVGRLFLWLTNDQELSSPAVILLTADRGRGKSSALGQLLGRFHGSALVCAPRKKAVGILYQHFSKNNHSNLTEPGFCPPDQLSTVATTDLLIIDEAAGIPLPLLRSAAARFNKIIFSSTVQGYEGAGRGFALRFGQLLQRDLIRYVNETLSTPIRWRANDPLEHFINSTLLLDAPLPELSESAQHLLTRPSTTMGRIEQHISELKLEKISADRLVDNETLLRSVYGLLVQAHYRTTPSDLSAMLDGENLGTYLLHYENNLVAAALIASEGPIDPLPIRQAILTKQRRPKGHLLPQLLAQYTMQAGALDHRYARIVRIAVVPQLQGVGIGSSFLHLLEKHMANKANTPDSHDVMGAVFGSVPDTLNFWLKNDYQPVHLGYRKQTSSGYASVTVLKNLKGPVNPIQAFANLLYQDSLSFRNGNDSKSVIKENTGQDTDASLFDRYILQRFVLNQRSFHDSHAAISRVAQQLPTHPKINSPLDHPMILLLRACEHPTASLKAMSVKHKFNSQNDVESALRTALGHWLSMNSINE